jgi:hypothetical protein
MSVRVDRKRRSGVAWFCGERASLLDISRTWKHLLMSLRGRDTLRVGRGSGGGFQWFRVIKCNLFLQELVVVIKLS